MKATCTELRAYNGQGKVKVNLTDLSELHAETPDELEIAVKSLGPEAVLEIIGKEKVMKHFNLSE